MIADFGLSRVMETDKLSLLTEICGTPGVSVYPSFFARLLPVSFQLRFVWAEEAGISCWRKFTDDGCFYFVLVHGPGDLQEKYVLTAYL
jgi:hypothetical protein